MYPTTKRQGKWVSKNFGGKKGLETFGRSSQTEQGGALEKHLWRSFKGLYGRRESFRKKFHTGTKREELMPQI